MGKKFDAIFEAVVSREGYLPGDVIVFRKNYKSCDCYKKLPSPVQKDLDEMVESGLNIKVVHVGDNLSGSNANNQYKTSENAVITVAADHGGGRWYSSITVSPDMIDLAESDGVNLPKIPDQFRREDKSDYKPEVYKRDNNFITNVTDKGNGKNTPTNLKLAGESTLIKNDMVNMAMLYESIYKKEETNDLDVFVEGWLRRFATKISGGGKGNPMRDRNRVHQFSKSGAMELSKDIAKVFGGDYSQHTNQLYDMIKRYLENISTSVK
jgi:hypothetical protein